MADVVRPPTRQETLDLLSGLRAAFLYGYFIEAVARRHCEDIPNEARAAKEFVFEGRSGERTALKLDLVAEWLENQENARTMRGNFFLLLTHQLVKMSYELVLGYCKHSKQTSKYGGESWLQFARVWRNVLSHGEGAVLTEWPKNLRDKGVLTVTWRDRTISESQVGTIIEDLDVVHALKLQEDMRSFLQGLD